MLREHNDWFIDPPLVNSATPWATTVEHLRELYECPFTGAVTVRTSTLNGFPHDNTIHQYGFFAPSSPDAKSSSRNSVGSLNTLGYSPIPLATTLKNLEGIIKQSQRSKPIIISITGDMVELAKCIELIDEFQRLVNAQILVEYNLSCPNIRGSPPPAYDFDQLKHFFNWLQPNNRYPALKFGIKLPPFSNPTNFSILEKALLEYAAQDDAGLAFPLHFITSTNTLGCSLLLDSDCRPQLSSSDGSGIGGLAGAPLHPLSLGNVKMIETMLQAHEALRQIRIIGIGGVSDHAGYQRMRSVGASVVGVGTAFGAEGVSIFEKILCPEK